MEWELLNQLKAACKGAIAKADQESNKYLPLWMHMADTAGIMIKLYEHRVSDQEKEFFIQQGVDGDRPVSYTHLTLPTKA